MLIVRFEIFMDIVDNLGGFRQITLFKYPMVYKVNHKLVFHGAPLNHVMAVGSNYGIMLKLCAPAHRP